MAARAGLQSSLSGPSCLLLGEQPIHSPARLQLGFHWRAGHPALPELVLVVWRCQWHAQSRTTRWSCTRRLHASAPLFRSASSLLSTYPTMNLLGSRDASWRSLHALGSRTVLPFCGRQDRAAVLQRGRVCAGLPPAPHCRAAQIGCGDVLFVRHWHCRLGGRAYLSEPRAQLTCGARSRASILQYTLTRTPSLPSLCPLPRWEATNQASCCELWGWNRGCPSETLAPLSRPSPPHLTHRPGALARSMLVCHSACVQCYVQSVHWCLSL